MERNQLTAITALDSPDTVSLEQNATFNELFTGRSDTVVVHRLDQHLQVLLQVHMFVNPLELQFGLNNASPVALPSYP